MLRKRASVLLVNPSLDNTNEIKKFSILLFYADFYNLTYSKIIQNNRISFVPVFLSSRRNLICSPTNRQTVNHFLNIKWNYN